MWKGKTHLSFSQSADCPVAPSLRKPLTAHSHVCGYQLYCGHGPFLLSRFCFPFPVFLSSCRWYGTQMTGWKRQMNLRSSTIPWFPVPAASSAQRRTQLDKCVDWSLGLLSPPLAISWGPPLQVPGCYLAALAPACSACTHSPLLAGMPMPRAPGPTAAAKNPTSPEQGRSSADRSPQDLLCGVSSELTD